MGVVRLFLAVFVFFLLLASFAFGAMYFRVAQEGSAPWELAVASATSLLFAGLLWALRRRIGHSESEAPLEQWYKASPEDLAFAQAFEAFKIAPEAFDHAAHARLAYTYLCEAPRWVAMDRMKKSLFGFLAHLRMSPTQYHETIARGWILAVAHVMGRKENQVESCDSAATFIARNPRLLDSKITLKRYSADLLIPPKAREGFVEFEHSPIPSPQPVPHKHRCPKCGTEMRPVIYFRRHSWMLSVAGFVWLMVVYAPVEGVPHGWGFELVGVFLILSPILLAFTRRCFKCEPLDWARK